MRLSKASMKKWLGFVTVVIILFISLRASEKVLQQVKPDFQIIFGILGRLIILACTLFGLKIASGAVHQIGTLPGVKNEDTTKPEI